MRPSSLAFAAALAVALPSGAALFGLGAAVCLPLIGVGFGVGLSLMAVVDVWDWWRHSQTDIRLDQARAWASELANQERELRLATPVADAPEPAAPPDDHGWYLAIEITLLAGQVRGFTDSGLEPIMGSDARPKVQRFLMARGLLALGPAGYGWADGVTLADALRRLRVGDLSPYPDEPAPKVTPPVQPATRRDARQHAAKVVDSTARPVV